MSITYTPELAAEICERLATGESLNAICASARMPNESSVRQWDQDDRDGFAAKYARAREAQAEHWASEIIEIADSVRHSATSEDVQAAKLAVDSRKWIASKLLPKRYGDKTVLSGDPDNPVKSLTRVEVVLVRPERRDT